MRISGSPIDTGEFRANVDASEILDRLPRPYDRIRADFEYFAEHQDDLKVKYPDQFVVILSKAVVANAVGLEELDRLLTERDLRSKAPVVMFVEKTPRNLSL